MIRSRIFFNQLVKNDITTRDNIRKIATGQEDDFFAYLISIIQRKIRVTAIDLNKQQTHDADPKVIKQIKKISSLLKQSRKISCISQK